MINKLKVNLMSILFGIMLVMGGIAYVCYDLHVRIIKGILESLL